MIKGSRAEIKCDACDGSGSLLVREPEPGRKIYPGRCTASTRMASYQLAATLLTHFPIFPEPALCYFRLLS